MCKVFESVRTGRSESRNRLNLKHENELSLFLCEFCVQFMKFNYSNGRFPWSTSFLVEAQIFIVNICTLWRPIVFTDSRLR